MSMEDFASMFRTFFGLIWSGLDTVSPFLGMSYKEIWLGFFAASLSITILVPLIGIGGKITRHGFTEDRFYRSFHKNDKE